MAIQQFAKKPVASITHVDNTTFSVPGGDEVSFQNAIDCILDSRDHATIPNFMGLLIQAGT